MTKAKAAPSCERYLPDHVDQTKATVLPKNRILFVQLAYDQDPSNPLTDCDGAGSIRSLNRKFTDHMDPEDFKALIEDDVDAVVLSYYEHGQCEWSVLGEPVTPGVEFQWDGTRVAGVWLPDKVLREDEAKGLTGEARRAKMVEWAKQACESYTDYCNGEVYGYDVRLYKARKADNGTVFDRRDDYRHDETLAEDSCWGFYGADYFRGQVLDVVAGMLKRKP